jgi:hypothetical protein
MSNWTEESNTNDAVQNHRLDTIERRLDKHDEMLAKLVEAQTRSEEQMTGLSASVETLAQNQTATQEMINGIGQSIVKWMMGIGSAMVAAILGMQGVM